MNEQNVSVSAVSEPREPIKISEDILRVDGLKMYFPVTKGLLKRTVGYVKAVDDVSFTIKRGSTLGIVGESGCGKSTLGKCVMQRLRNTEGSIIFNGKDVSRASVSELRNYHREMQMITQDPYAALDPRMSIRSIILEGVHIQGVDRGWSEQQKDALVRDMLTMVGLNTRFADRFPHEFSGGQRQRINIARALAVSPSFLICDEIVSALDVSIQAQIVKLMMDIQKELGLTYIFIGHDLSVVRHVSNQVAVMYLGQFVELTDSDELYAKPLHPYTKALISAAPIPDPEVDATRERILLEGEVPSAIDPPKGCNFCTRCPHATSFCMEQEPKPKEVLPGHFVACHHVREGGEWIG
ncbi:MAG: ABC transporter ATP-binding protein [Oscillospiraceae bacterium]